MLWENVVELLLEELLLASLTGAAPSTSLSKSSSSYTSSGAGGSVFSFVNMKGSMENGSWIESFVGGSCE